MLIFISGSIPGLTRRHLIFFLACISGIYLIDIWDWLGGLGEGVRKFSWACKTILYAYGREFLSSTAIQVFLSCQELAVQAVLQCARRFTLNDD